MSLNTYAKFVPNVFLAKCAKPHQRVDEVLTIKVDCFYLNSLYTALH
ncbi:hypothetical protein [Histophilus somni]|nr:hypothetical protein [Histophilus somni]